MEPLKLLKLAECLSDDQMESMEPKLLGKWPNTYAFTKAVAEDVIHKQGHNMPIGMIRPAIGK